MFIDDLQLLLNKYSPAILDPLIKAVKVFQFTIPPQIIVEEDASNDLTYYNFKVIIQSQNKKNRKYSLKFYLPIIHSDIRLYDIAAEDAVKLSPNLKYLVNIDESFSTFTAFLFLITLAYKQLALSGTLHSKLIDILSGDFDERNASNIFSIKSSLDTYIMVRRSLAEEE